MMTGRTAFSLVELVMATVVLVGALVPMYFLFTGSSKSVFRSRVSYMALHVAREELEALRQVPPERVPEMRHDWLPVTGSIFRGVTPPGAEAAELAPGATIDYPDEYSRIETKLSISSAADAAGDVGAPAHPRLYRVLLEVRWQEMGASEEEGGAGHRRALSRFQTVLANHRIK